MQPCQLYPWCSIGRRSNTFPLEILSRPFPFSQLPSFDHFPSSLAVINVTNALLYSEWSHLYDVTQSNSTLSFLLINGSKRRGQFQRWGLNVTQCNYLFKGAGNNTLSSFYFGLKRTKTLRWKATKQYRSSIS